jgi:hypothetical protein
MASARRFSIASSECRNSSSENSSATIRLISSGIVRSKLRRPASRCSTVIPSFTATSVAASVVHVAGHDHEVGPLIEQHWLDALHTCGLHRVRAGADAEHVVRLGHAELLEEQLGHHAVVVLAAVDEGVAAVREAPPQLRDRPGHFHEVRARADDRRRSASQFCVCRRVSFARGSY